MDLVDFSQRSGGYDFPRLSHHRVAGHDIGYAKYRGGGGGAVNRVGSVAYNRAHGLNKGAGGPGKSSGAQGQAVARTNSYTNAQMAGNAGNAPGLVRARRQAQQNSGLSMKAYKAGVASGFINKHGEKNTSTGGGGVSNQFGGSAWDNLNKNFNQSEWDSHVKTTFDNYVKENASKGSGLAKGPEWKGAQLGENGFFFDANYPTMIPALGKYGFKAGDMAFDPSKHTKHAANMDGREGAGITGRISVVKKNGEVRFETDGSGANPNWDKYAAPGSERMSSEGLYQDRYNVGYHGADDQGDEYASNAALGSIASYFKDYNAGTKSFGEAYNSFVDGNRKGGYAGDVLKMIDSGRMKVSDDQYNMIVTDAKNYDWDHRGKIAGKYAHGGGTYDSRVGGVSGKHVTAMDNWQQNQDAGYYQAGSMDPAEAAAMYGNDATGAQASSQDYQRQQEIDTLGNPGGSNPNLNSGGSNAYNNWLDTRQFGGQVPQQQNNYNSSNYSFDNRSQKSNQKGLNIDFNFNANRFNQGQ